MPRSVLWHELTRKIASAGGRGAMQAVKDRLVARYVVTKASFMDTYTAVKAVFEKNSVAFTISASLASAGAAWAGYTARQVHQKKVEDRLNSIEQVMATVHHLEEAQVQALTYTGLSYTACAATAGTTLVIGYGLGWRGGRWSAMKKFQKQQQKLLQASSQKSLPSKSSLSQYVSNLRTGTKDVSNFRTGTKDQVSRD